ncbi:MAG: hypothetical protein AAFM91_07920 [Pseudomonadota bacterium]
MTRKFGVAMSFGVLTLFELAQASYFGSCVVTAVVESIDTVGEKDIARISITDSFGVGYRTKEEAAVCKALVGTTDKVSVDVLKGPPNAYVKGAQFILHRIDLDGVQNKDDVYVRYRLYRN